MIQRTELKEHAKTRQITNIGHAEKDYLQDIMLQALSQHVGTALVFKGGTALAKCYGLDRFSDDLDFTAADDIDADKLMRHISNHLNRFNATHTHEQLQEHEHSIHHRFKIEGPLYDGNDRSRCSIHIDINTASTIKTRETSRIHPPYPDIPSFSLSTLSREEIAAEKIRAILTRDAPRDIYDLHFLLEQGTTTRADFIDSKLEYYGKTWDLDAFKDNVQDREQEWGAHMPQLIHGPLPAFSKVVQEIINRLE